MKYKEVLVLNRHSEDWVEVYSVTDDDLECIHEQLECEE